MSSGRFQPGYDPRRHRYKVGQDDRRHKLTREECQDGFWAALESIQARYPEAIDRAGRHMSCNFLKRRKKLTLLEQRTRESEEAEETS